MSAGEAGVQAGEPTEEPRRCLGLVSCYACRTVWPREECLEVRVQGAPRWRCPRCAGVGKPKEPA